MAKSPKRMGIGHHEGMTLDHLLLCLRQAREKAHRMAIRLQQNVWVPLGVGHRTLSPLTSLVCLYFVT